VAVGSKLEKLTTQQHSPSNKHPASANAMAGKASNKRPVTFHCSQCKQINNIEISKSGAFNSM
jgi:hypothetical protein